MKLLITTAAIALSMTATAQATNNTVMFAKGYWRVTHMARNIDGDPMCLMGSQVSLSGGNNVGSIFIKRTKKTPFIEFNKTNWHFSADKQVQFAITLDKGVEEFFGVTRVSATINAVQAFLPRNSWLDDFAASDAMTVKFHNGNEPQWSVKMAGSREALNSFLSCIKMLDEQDTPPQATSPLPDETSTQPAPTSPVQTVPIKKPKGERI